MRKENQNFKERQFLHIDVVFLVDIYINLSDM